MKRIPPYVIFAICGVLFLSMGMIIITADGEATAPGAEVPPDAQVLASSTPTPTPTLTLEAIVEQPLLPTVEPPPVEPVVPPADVVAQQPEPPPADGVVELPATEVLPAEVPLVEPVPLEPVPTRDGVIVEQGIVAAAGQPTPGLPVEQPTMVVVPPVDLQATVVAPVEVVPATIVPAAAQPLGTLPPPSNVIPPTIMPNPAQVYGQIIMPLRTDFTGVVVTLSLPDGSALQTLTDSRGVFTFVNLLPGDYRVDAGTTGYLSSQFAFALGEGQSLTLPPATLISGDTNADNRIDLSDAVLIAANFNLTAITPADLNNDGVVDIRDLTAIGTYFGKAGPMPWQ